MSQDFVCTICGNSYKNSRRGSTSHARKHKRQFAEQTGMSNYMNYDIVKAYFNAEDAANWAEEIVEKLREHGAFDQPTLEDFEDE